MMTRKSLEYNDRDDRNSAPNYFHAVKKKPQSSFPRSRPKFHPRTKLLRQFTRRDACVNIQFEDTRKFRSLFSPKIDSRATHAPAARAGSNSKRSCDRARESRLQLKPEKKPHRARLSLLRVQRLHYSQSCDLPEFKRPSAMGVKSI